MTTLGQSDLVRGAQLALDLLGLVWFEALRSNCRGHVASRNSPNLGRQRSVCVMLLMSIAMNNEINIERSCTSRGRLW